MDKYYNSKVCKYYSQGYCKFKNCRYEHPEMEYRIESNNTSFRVGNNVWVSKKTTQDPPQKLEIKDDKKETKTTYDLFKNPHHQELFNRFSQMKQDLGLFQQFDKQIQEKTALDLMFIVDCTGSMSIWIETVRTELRSIIKKITSVHPNSEIRISFVGYRDYDHEENRFSIMDFNSDIEEVLNFISKIETLAGCDDAEDVAGGLKKALQQDWKAPARYAILICDAPTHGKRYHMCNLKDDYLKGDPDGLFIEDLVQEMAEMKIVLSAIEITIFTRKMFSVMSKAYSEVSQCRMSVALLGTNSKKDFAAHVANGASSTLSSISFNGIKMRDLLDSFKNRNSTMVDSKNSKQMAQLVERINVTRFCLDQDQGAENIVKNKHIEDNKLSDESLVTKLKLKRIPRKELDFKNLSEKKLNAVCYSLSLIKDQYNQIDWKNPTFSKSEIKSEIYLTEAPFAEGVMRYSFYMYDPKLDQELVGKINKNQKLSKFNLNDLSKDMESLLVCQSLSNEFNDKIINIVPDTRLLLNFVNSFIYEIQSEKANSIFKYLFTENYIKGDYKKYNNNSGWTTNDVTESSLIADCFSHFSWHFTKGYMLVVDLQGVDGYLTDPQIHCLNPYKYGDGNFGYFGIIKYFITHTCNKYCVALNLLNPKSSLTIDNKFLHFFDGTIEKPVNPSQLIFKQCCLCRFCFKIQAQIAYNIQVKKGELICPKCQMKIHEKKEKIRCDKCKNVNLYSDYYYKMKRTDFPRRCKQCQNQ